MKGTTCAILVASRGHFLGKICQISLPLTLHHDKGDMPSLTQKVTQNCVVTTELQVHVVSLLLLSIHCLQVP